MTTRQTFGTSRAPTPSVKRAVRIGRGAAFAAIAGATIAGAEARAQGLDDQVGVPVGDATLYPSLRVDYLVDSNVGLRSEDEVEGTAVVVSPRLDFLADRRQLTFALGYEGAFSASDESAIEYADHALSAELSAEFDARRRGSVALRLRRDHEALGLDLTRGLADSFDEPVKLNSVDLQTRFAYGVDNARGNLFLGLDVGGRSYTNLSSVTDGRDFTRLEPYAAFGYRVGGDTRAIVELRFGSVSFDDADDDRDEISLLAGANFAATGKLNGGFRLGFTQASFARDGVEDEAALVARTDLNWLPREAAVIGLVLQREFDNTTSTRVGEDQSIRTTARIGWNHQWSTRFSTNAFAQLDDLQRACPAQATTTTSLGVEFDLSIRRWLDIGASVGQTGRTADDCPGDAAANDLDFDRTLYGVHVRATL